MSRQNLTSRTLSALTDWVERTRERAPLLDDEADALLARLQQLESKASAISNLSDAPRTLGLYGYCGAGKAFLLSTLASSQPERLNVAPGGKHLDYLTHINPGNSATAMAVRFTRDEGDLPDRFALRLRLLSESELVQIFIAHYYANGAVRTLTDAQIQQRLAPLRALCQPQAHPVVHADDVAALADFWRETTPKRQQSLTEASWHQLATLLPALTLNERVRVYALLWGENQELTQQWLALAQALELLGNAPEVAAPLSLLVDAFSLPAEGFLLPGGAADERVQVCPLETNGQQPALSVPVATLALLTRELVLPLVDATQPHDTDLLDIPGAQPDHSLASCKTRWLLTCYRQRQQPDVLLVCNAAPERAAIIPAARALRRWVDDTQPQTQTQPNLVWAITPFDARFQGGQHLDEGVQRLLGKPGARWGALQALDARNVQRLVEWLGAALDDENRQARHAALETALTASAQALFQRYLGTESGEEARSRAEQEVRALQRQASRHGDVLEALLPAGRVQSADDDTPPGIIETTQAIFSESIDLFGDETASAPAPERQMSKSEQNPHHRWVNHVRHWAQQPDNAAALGLEPTTLRWLGETLAVASYRLKLDEQLDALANDEAQRHAALANFISWLGYAETPLAQRPASRINKGAAIFAPVASSRQRLTRLADQPVHAATRYVYDWLVALYTLACDNVGYRHPLDVNDRDRQALADLFAK